MSEAPQSMASIDHVNVRLAQRSYPIAIGYGALETGWEAIDLKGFSRVFVVSNPHVFALYGERLMRAVGARHADVRNVLLPDGEDQKSWQSLNQIFDALLVSASDRKTLLVALGGGVIGDMVGFAAAIYQRGIAFVQVPTTLLAQVDSSVGGKTAINHALGKNMIGAFHQPIHVLIDTSVLQTLPAREFRAGLAEVIKYGVALDATFFAWLEENLDALNAQEPPAMREAIKRSCEIKARVVADDEFETRPQGGRALLNFGHTFGHAIESALGYGVWLHGEAVGCGMALATKFSASLNRISADEAERVLALITRAGLEVEPPRIAPDVWLTHMARDKKNERGRLRLILLDAIGQSSTDASIDADTVKAFLAGH